MNLSTTFFSQFDDPPGKATKCSWAELFSSTAVLLQDGPWSCNQSQLAITCSDACDSCKQDTCSCGKSGYWQDPTDPDKCKKAEENGIEYNTYQFQINSLACTGAFVFGAQTPAGFNLLVKQKPAGQLYVEYDVVCSRQVFSGTDGLYNLDSDSLSVSILKTRTSRDGRTRCIIG